VRAGDKRAGVKCLDVLAWPLGQDCISVVSH